MAKPNVISKESLLDAAKQCLVERGIQRFTLRAVAETGGVTQGTVYYHFRTKDQLLIDIAKSVSEQTSNVNDGEGEQARSISEVLASSKKHTASDSFYYKLLLTLIVIGFDNSKIAEQMGTIFDFKNKTLTDNIVGQWTESPIKGVSLETWGILVNSLIDGLALQALQTENISIDKVYEELEVLMNALSGFSQEPREEKSDRGFGMLKRNSLFY